MVTPWGSSPHFLAIDFAFAKRGNNYATRVLVIPKRASHTISMRVRPVLLFFLLLVLTALYLVPGTEALWNGRTDTVMSDDTDPSPLPTIYDEIIRIWKQHPSYLFYGSVYADQHSPEPSAYWISWAERWTIVALSPFVALEQLSTAVVFVLLIANAVAFYLLARYLKWHWSVASGLSIAWAFSTYTRARAKVHQGLVGIYHVPLLFLAVLLIARGKGKRSVFAAAVCVLLAMSVNHYYLVASVFLSPFYFAFLFLQKETRAEPRRILKRGVIALLPALLFMAWNFARPLPPDAAVSFKDVVPHADESPAYRRLFMKTYAAWPIDFLVGDIALNEKADDWNPLRKLVNERVLKNMGYGNSHEHTNGIRWVLLALALVALAELVRKRGGVPAPIPFFAIFGLFTFWASLGPDAFSPSVLLNDLVPPIRVPSRMGIQVAFSVLMLSGYALGRGRLKKYAEIPWLFPILMVLTYPPLVQSMPMAPMRPAFQSLQRDRGECGLGMYFPFVSNADFALFYYHFLQRLRGTDCLTLNGLPSIERLRYITGAFPPHADFVNTLSARAEVAPKLEKFARCIPLSWIAFDGSVPADWRGNVCRDLGWSMDEDLVCRAPHPTRVMQNPPERCL